MAGGSVAPRRNNVGGDKIHNPVASLSPSRSDGPPGRGRDKRDPPIAARRDAAPPWLSHEMSLRQRHGEGRNEAEWAGEKFFSKICIYPLARRSEFLIYYALVRLKGPEHRSLKRGA